MDTWSFDDSDSANRELNIKRLFSETSFEMTSSDEALILLDKYSSNKIDKNLAWK